MSVFDRDILITNIKNLMSNTNTTQEKLAKALGMSQPNLSKALNPKDKKCFTVAQLVEIADHFNVSVDELVHGRKPRNISTGPRATAAFIATLLEEHDAVMFEHNVTEEVYSVDYSTFQLYPTYKREDETISYPAIYLPSYWKAPSCPQNIKENELLCEAQQCGNDTTMQPVNDFLKHYKEILEVYEQGNLSEDTYRTVLADLLSHLRE